MTRTPRAGIVQANNSSTIPGIRLRRRQPRYGQAVLGLDVTYYDTAGDRRSTTFPATVDGMQRALELREGTVGAPIDVDPATALRRMKRRASR
jgi:hypothetical protein